MAKNQFQLLKPIVILACICIGWLILPIFVKSFMRVSFFEMQAPLHRAASYIHDVQVYWGLKNHSKKELIEAGRDLARLNASYELRIKENIFLQEEINRLEKILNLPSLPGYRYEVARVCQRDINVWWQYCIIRKGKLQNIKKGAAVIYAGGIVGRIKEVYLNSAVVELVTNQNFRIAAHFEKDDRLVTYQGLQPRAFNTPIGEVKDVPTDIQPSSTTPLRLVTTHLGGVFPEGLTIGWVYSLDRSSDGLFQIGEVLLNNQLLEIQEVVVLIPEDTFKEDAL